MSTITVTPWRSAWSRRRIVDNGSEGKRNGPKRRRLESNWCMRCTISVLRMWTWRVRSIINCIEKVKNEELTEKEKDKERLLAEMEQYERQLEERRRVEAEVWLLSVDSPRKSQWRRPTWWNKWMRSSRGSSWCGIRSNAMKINFVGRRMSTKRRWRQRKPKEGLWYYIYLSS